MAKSALTKLENLLALLMEDGYFLATRQPVTS
jgi:hypothetical protein